MSNVIQGGFLTLDEIIQKQPSENIITIDGWDTNAIVDMLREQQKENSVVVDLALGDEFFLSSRSMPEQLGINQNTHIIIEPGEFALLTTLAKFNIPDDIMAFISMRFRHSLKGLINISGFHVDPGYSGRIIFSVYNAGPNRIVLERNAPAFMMIFSRLGQKVKVHKDKKFHNIDRITPDHIQGLSGEPISLRNLDKRINKLEDLKNVLYITISGLAGTVLYLIINAATATKGGTG